MCPVARGRSLFGDPTADIQELTQVIKQDISKLNSDIGSLQQQARAQSYGESKHMRTHTSSVVISLQVSHEAAFCSCCYSSPWNCGTDGRVLCSVVCFCLLVR